MSDQQRLVMPGERENDLAWMRSEIKERALGDVTDHHLEKFLDLAEGDKAMAVEAIATIYGGHTHEPLRELIERRRGAG